MRMLLKQENSCQGKNLKKIQNKKGFDPFQINVLIQEKFSSKG